MADTREKTVNESSPVALGLAILACAGVLAAGVAWGDARNRLTTAEQNRREDLVRIKQVEDAAAASAVKSAASDANLLNISNRLDSMDRKLDRALEQGRGVRNARDER